MLHGSKMPEQSKTQTAATSQRRGGRRDKGTACTDAALHKWAGNEQGQFCQRGHRGTLAPAHIMRIVKECQLQSRDFILVLCSLLCASRKLPFVKSNLQEDFRVPGLLMPLPNSRQQYPESLKTLKANFIKYLN